MTLLRALGPRSDALRRYERGHDQGFLKEWRDARRERRQRSPRAATSGSGCSAAAPPGGSCSPCRSGQYDPAAAAREATAAFGPWAQHRRRSRSATSRCRLSRTYTRHRRRSSPTGGRSGEPRRGRRSLDATRSPSTDGRCAPGGVPRGHRRGRRDEDATSSSARDPARRPGPASIQHRVGADGARARGHHGDARRRHRVSSKTWRPSPTGVARLRARRDCSHSCGEIAVASGTAALIRPEAVKDLERASPMLAAHQSDIRTAGPPTAQSLGEKANARRFKAVRDLVARRWSAATAGAPGRTRDIAIHHD
jgi:hypothetical protein